jgi:hypothetical protein
MKWDKDWGSRTTYIKTAPAHVKIHVSSIIQVVKHFHRPLVVAEGPSALIEP